MQGVLLYIRYFIYSIFYFYVHFFLFVAMQRERNVPKKEKHTDCLITTKLNLSGLTRFARTKSALLLFR